MTTLEAIVERLQTAAPSWQYRIGFGADLMDFIQQATIPAPTVFISVGEHAPNVDTLTEAFRYERFIEHFSIFIRRAEFSPDEAGVIYQQYLDIRDALNGYTFKTSRGGVSMHRVCAVETGTPLYEGGFAAAQLSIAVY